MSVQNSPLLIKVLVRYNSFNNFNTRYRLHGIHSWFLATKWCLWCHSAVITRLGMKQDGRFYQFLNNTTIALPKATWFPCSYCNTSVVNAQQIWQWLFDNYTVNSWHLHSCKMLPWEKWIRKVQAETESFHSQWSTSGCSQFPKFKSLSFQIGQAKLHLGGQATINSTHNSAH